MLLRPEQTMIFRVTCALLWLGTLSFVLSVPAGAQDTGARVSVEQLQNRIAAAEDAADLDDVTRLRLIDLYRQSINNLEAVRVNREVTEEYRQENRSAPKETEKILARIEQRRDTDPLASLSVSEATATDTLIRELDEELANQTAVEAKLALLDARLESEASRPVEARQRIGAARAEVTALGSQAAEPLAADQSPKFAEAARWARQTRLEALQTEIAMLDRELLSYTARNALLEAQRAEQAQGLTRINARVEVLREMTNERRRTEADRAIAQAQRALERATAEEPLLREAGERNLELVEQLKAQVEELDRLAELARALPATGQIEAAFRSARRKLELEGAGAPVGQAVFEERGNFPSTREFEVERRRVSRGITAVSLRLIQTNEERQKLSDVGAYIDQRLAERGGTELDAEARQELQDLYRTRRTLLERIGENDRVLQRRLFVVDDALKGLVSRTRAYDEFLRERLLWVRSTKRVDARQWWQLPAEIARYLSPAPWLGAVGLATVRAVEAPGFLLLALVAVALALRARHFKRSLVESGKKVGRIREDSMAITFGAIGYSVLLAAPLPLLLGAIGGGLATAPEGPEFATVIGEALVRVALWLAFPLLLLDLFRGDGVAGRHFGWDQETLTDVRRQLRVFVATAFPIYFVLRTSNTTDQLTGSFGGLLTLLAFLALMVSLLWLVIGLGHPTRGAARRVLSAHPESAWWRWRYGWFPVALLLPIALGVLAYSGYLYTTQELTQSVFESIWLVTAIWLVAGLVRRWLLMTSRRLAYNKARAALEAARAKRAGEAGAAEPGEEGDIGEPEIDLVALDTDSRQLLNAAVLLFGVLGLAAVWGNVVPALGIFEQVSLWNKTDLVDGVEQLVPVTLNDLLLAVVVVIGSYVLATNLPSLLNIILLKQGRVSAGTRYTVQTLTSYAITGLAILLVLNLLGVRAAQLGWAAAALGVGIGFGLQEIVANFICGLILLFERPIRVGDIITVGDATGTVNKIRIRATTIRDWEQKELFIPNKELITGRLLNWTLSDAMTRITVVVGVAYGSDTDKAMALMREAAEECPTVLAEPAPFVHFEEFADSTLNLTLRIFVGSPSERLASQTDVLKRIDQKFKDAGIVIAFPQRDVHIFAEPSVSAASAGGTPGPVV